jgi:hypothetical protein
MTRTPIARALLALVSLATGAPACGGEGPPARPLTLAEGYDLVGVARVAPDGIAASALTSVRLALEGVVVQGGRVRAELRGEASAPVALEGAFSSETRTLRFEPTQGAFTGTVTESLTALGARADDDGAPSDGVADELSGFLRLTRGAAVLEATLLGAARASDRPPAPDARKVAAAVSGLGRVRLAGAAGAVIPFSGVELLRFSLGLSEPRFALVQAREDGSFEIQAEGLPADVFVVRVRAAGRASDAVALPIVQ